MSKLKNVFLIFTIIAMALLSQQIIVNATTNQTNKIDLAELSHIRYGLLSIDEWKNQISSIVTEEIDNLDFESPK
ncbi:MAG: hypothetical protein K2Q18_14875, partial [Bdellovibrionales bacterium]|nr:hypothetical protein [Bdellovibrionales bacterium]